MAGDEGNQNSGGVELSSDDLPVESGTQAGVGVSGAGVSGAGGSSGSAAHTASADTTLGPKTTASNPAESGDFDDVNVGQDGSMQTGSAEQANSGSGRPDTEQSAVDEESAAGAEESEDEDSDDSDEGPIGIPPHALEPEQDDPLGEAYDLELGSKLSRAPEPGDLPWRSDVTSAKEFFNTEILYRYDILNDEEQQQLNGTYRIELRGQNGGVWTITLKEQLDVVNRREEAEIVMSMAQRDFLNLVNGRLNPQLALLSQKLRITGDLRKGVAFQSILTPNGD